MLRVARKYHTHLAAIRLSPQLRAQLPAWYHPLANPRSMATIPARCLLRRHTVTTVADLIAMSDRIHTPSLDHPHLPTPTCACQTCARDRREGCRNPHQCASEALARIRQIEPKLNPLSPDHHGNFSLTPNRKAANIRAKENNNDILFDPSITCKNDLAECFRIFTNPDKISNLSAARNYTRRFNVRYRNVPVHTDGACYNNGKLNARCGSGIWFAPNDPRNDAIKIPGPHQSNQIGEIAAVIQATSATQLFRPLTIISDSMYVINGLTSHLSTWEDIGWIGIKNADLFKRAAYLLKSRTTTTHFRWIKGHSGDQGNEECDRLAKMGADKPLPDPLSLDVPTAFDLQGAKLSALNQATAYRGIMERLPPQHRATTSENIQRTREALHEYNGLLETDESIWSGMQQRTLRTRVKQFLYKAMHGTQKVGKFWHRIATKERREFCKKCRVTESMEHILVHCREAPQRTIWTLAEELWPDARNLWPEISLGIILGCGSITIPPEGNQEDPDER